MRRVCSKPTRTPRVVEEQERAFRQFSKSGGGITARSYQQALSEQSCTTCKPGSRASVQRWKRRGARTGGRTTESAEEGANLVRQPVTPDEPQGFGVDESMDDALNLE